MKPKTSTTMMMLKKMVTNNDDIKNINNNIDDDNNQIYPLPRLKNFQFSSTSSSSSSLSSKMSSATISSNFSWTRRRRHLRPQSSSSSSSFSLFSSSSSSSIIFLINSIIILILIIFSATTTTINAQNYETEFDYLNDPQQSQQQQQNCFGEWKYPINCSTFNCDYKATWEYRDDNDEIIFTISTRNRNKWTGIGFSDNQAMPDTDAILGLVEESGRFFLMDSYLRAYEAPPLDQQQNLYNMSAWRENGLTTLRFSRPRQTGDTRDYQFSDQQCPYFIFPVMGGVFNAVNKRIRKHESTPIISERRICVRSCRPKLPATTTITTTSTTSSTTTTMVTPTLNHLEDSDPSSDDGSSDGSSNGSSTNPESEKLKIYQAELKFLNLITPQFNTRPTPETLKQLESGLFRELRPYFYRLKKLEIQDLKLDPNNNIVMVDLYVAQSIVAESNHHHQDDNKFTTDNEKEDIRQLTNAIQLVIKDSKIDQRWLVDSNHLVVTPKENKSWMNIVLSTFNRFNEEEQKWIIIGAGLSALVLLALIQLFCMFCNCCGCGSGGNGGNGSSGGKRSSEHDDYINEKDDKQWQQEQQFPSSIYNSYNNVLLDEYGYPINKTNSLHKNYRGLIDNGGGMDPRSLHYMNGGHNHHHNHNHHVGHQSLDRRQLQQQQQYYDQQHRRQNGYEMNERQQHNHHHHHHHPRQNGPGGGPGPGGHLQPDFYFMPHQRKYSSDVVRVYVDYDGN